MGAGCGVYPFMARQKRRVTLIHNGEAGNARHSRAELVKLLESAGYAVTYLRYKHDDWQRALDRPAELVVAAGGDGTVAKVAAAVPPDGPPLAILPLGTANNLAKYLGVPRPLPELVAGWSIERTRPFHPIEAMGPWGTRRVVEGIGLGAFEQAIADLPETVEAEQACGLMAEAVVWSAPEHLELRLDGETLDQAFALLEVGTIPLVGPNLRLLAAADPAQPKFAVAFVGEHPDEREALARWIAEPPDGRPAPVAIRTAERATIRGRFRRARLNGNVWEADPAPDPDSLETITLRSDAEPIRFVAPA
jgi:diacylglycerol kinase (ATP)